MAFDWSSLIQPVMSALAGYGQVIGERLNRKWQEEQNEKDRQFERDMYEWTRHDAIADWEREAAYNSPEQQMTRLRQAGLNPNLVYGKGAEATMGSVRAGQRGGGNQPAPRMSPTMIPEMVDRYFRNQNVQAQTDNLHTQQAVMREEAILKSATTAKTLQDTARSEFDLSQSQRLKDIVVEQAELNNERLKAETTSVTTRTAIDLRRDEREQLMNAVNVQATVQSILESKLRQAKLEVETAGARVDYTGKQLDISRKTKEIEMLEIALKNAGYEGRVKQLEAELAAKGLRPNDPLWWREMMKGLGAFNPFPGPDDKGEFEKWLNNRK